MSTTLHIFLSTNLALHEAAHQLAVAVNGEMVEQNGRLYVSFQDDGAQMGGELERNPYEALPDPEPDEISVIDGYDLAYDIRRAPRDDDARLVVGRQLLDSIADRLRWPALLVTNLSGLVAAWKPNIGRTDFPVGTSPDGKDQKLWQPYAV